MARYPRVKNTEAEEIYSISTKENGKHYIFDPSKPKNKANIQLFLSVLKKAKQRYKFIVYGFAIMSNHVHLSIKPNHQYGDISDVMRYINGRFSYHYNKMHKNDGQRNWKERFSSKIVRDKKYFRNMLRYFILNPVRAGIVDDPMDHPYHLGHTIMTADEEKPAFGDLVDLDEIGQDVIDYLRRFILHLQKFVRRKARQAKSYFMKLSRKKHPELSFSLTQKRADQFYRYFSGPMDIVRELRKKFKLKGHEKD